MRVAQGPLTAAILKVESSLVSSGGKSLSGPCSGARPSSGGACREVWLAHYRLIGDNGRYFCSIDLLEASALAFMSSSRVCRLWLHPSNL
jgi:hypothetical protein